MNQKKIILLIGGPGSGKTSLLEALESKGFVCYPEISREVTKKAQEEGIEQLFLEDPILFSKLLLQGRIEQYKQATEEQEEMVFIDRGIPDVLAYMDFKGDTSPKDFYEACELYKYHKIFIFPPWEAIYQCDNERYETFEQAVAIHNYLVKTYEYYGYDLIEVPKDSVPKRVEYILKHL